MLPPGRIQAKIWVWLVWCLLAAHVYSVAIALHEGDEAMVAVLGGATMKSQPTAKRDAKMA